MTVNHGVLSPCSKHNFTPPFSFGHWFWSFHKQLQIDAILKCMGKDFKFWRKTVVQRNVQSKNSYYLYLWTVSLIDVTLGKWRHNL